MALMDFYQHVECQRLDGERHRVRSEEIPNERVRIDPVARERRQHVAPAQRS